MLVIPVTLVLLGSGVRRFYQHISAAKRKLLQQLRIFEYLYENQYKEMNEISGKQVLIVSVLNLSNKLEISLLCMCSFLSS